MHYTPGSDLCTTLQFSPFEPVPRRGDKAVASWGMARRRPSIRRSAHRRRSPFILGSLAPWILGTAQQHGQRTTARHLWESARRRGHGKSVTPDAAYAAAPPRKPLKPWTGRRWAHGLGNCLASPAPGGDDDPQLTPPPRPGPTLPNSLDVHPPRLGRRRRGRHGATESPNAREKPPALAVGRKAGFRR